jgi:hypothetical protein
MLKKISQDRFSFNKELIFTIIGNNSKLISREALNFEYPKFHEFASNPSNEIQCFQGFSLKK